MLFDVETSHDELNSTRTSNYFMKLYDIFTSILRFHFTYLNKRKILFREQKQITTKTPENIPIF